MNIKFYKFPIKNIIIISKFKSEKDYNKDQLNKIKTPKYKITKPNNVATDASENITISLKNVLVPGYLDGGTVDFKVTVTDKAGNKNEASYSYVKYMECGSNTKTLENNSPGLSTCAASSSCGVYGTETPYTNYSLYTYDSVTGARCSATNWSVAETPIENSSNCAAFYYACPSTVPGITTQTCTATTEIKEKCGNDVRKKVKETYSDCRTNEYYVDCIVDEIEFDLNKEDAVESENKGMDGVGPDSSTGKGPIFNRKFEGVAEYSCNSKRGMDVDVSCSGYRKYAASSCMNVYDFERRFKYRIKWKDDQTQSEYRYAKIPIGSTKNIDTKFEDRKSPITVNLYEDTSSKVLRYDCSNNGNIDVSGCGHDTGLTPNVTKHVYYVKYGDITSNRVALYTKYFANCGY